MSTLPTEFQRPRADKIRVTRDALVVDLADGRTIITPLSWYPRLHSATPAERRKWRLIAAGEGIHWPDLDEDISIEGLLAGSHSGESQASFQRWLKTRLQRRSNSALQPTAGTRRRKKTARKIRARRG
jgi:hypothetical protein